MLSPHSGQVMNIICSDQTVGRIGASSTGPRGPANRATRLRLTGAFLEGKPRAGWVTVYPRSRAKNHVEFSDDSLGHIPPDAKRPRQDSNLRPTA